MFNAGRLQVHTNKKSYKKLLYLGRKFHQTFQEHLKGSESKKVSKKLFHLCSSNFLDVRWDFNHTVVSECPYCYSMSSFIIFDFDCTAVRIWISFDLFCPCITENGLFEFSSVLTKMNTQIGFTAILTETAVNKISLMIVERWNNKEII